MTTRARIAALLVAAGAAPALAQTDRYWVAPLIGSWSTASNWGLFPGGPANGGLPQTGDEIAFTERSVCIINGTGIAVPIFDRVTLAGSGSGITSVQHATGIMNPTLLEIGKGATDCEYLLSGSMQSVVVRVGEGDGAEGDLRVINGGELVTQSISVGTSLGTGTLTVSDAFLQFETMRVSENPSIFERAGHGSVEVTSGQVVGDLLDLGENSSAQLEQTGGTIQLERYEIESRNGVPATVSDHSGGVLEITEMLSIGDPSGGTCLVTIDGAQASIESLRVGDEAAGDARLVLMNGSLDAGDVTVGRSGNGGLQQYGGAFTAQSLLVGTGTSENAAFENRGGTATIVGSVTIGELGASGPIVTIKGTMDATDVLVAVGSESTGELEVDRGLLIARDVFIGRGGYGIFQMFGGELLAENLTIEGAGEPADPFATITSGVIHLTGGLDISGQFLVGSGLIEADTIVNAPTGLFTTGNAPVIRAAGFINNGEFWFGSTGVEVSGPLLGGGTTTGSFVNNGTFLTSSNADSRMQMDFQNNGELFVGASRTLPVIGAFTNNGTTTIENPFAPDSSNGSLRVISAVGVFNTGSVVLDNGTLEAVAGPIINNGDILGRGEITGDLTNNGRIARGAVFGELELEGAVVFGRNAEYDWQRYPGVNNLIRLRGGSIELGGTLNADFEFFAPALGATYALITADAGTISGTFDTVNITDGFGEVVYESDRVLLRVTGCNDADLAAPVGVLDLSDINVFVNGFLSMDAAADLNGDGVLDLVDINLFVNAFVTGCP